MSSATQSRSFVTTVDAECLHLMDPSTCSWCRPKPKKVQERTGVLVQIQHDGNSSCSDCGTRLHKGDMILKNGRTKYCSSCH